MEFISTLVDNYKTTTKDFNPLIKIISALLLAFIIFSVVSAFVNVIANGV